MARHQLREVFGRLLGKKKVASDIQEIETIVQELLMLLESHDRETYHHSRRVVNYAVLMAQRLGITGDMLCSLYYGASLHDIGKLDVPQEILKNRRTLRQRLRGVEAALTGEQVETIKNHPVAGYERLIKLAVKEEIAEVALYHHKNKDGYPAERDLAWFGKEDYPTIPLLAVVAEREGQEYVPFLSEVVSVADTFDAITGPRVYQKQRTKEEALEALRKGIGTEYDGRCVAALEDVIKKNEDIIEILQLYPPSWPLGPFSRS